MRTLIAGLLMSLATPVLASDISLSLPIDCELGETCHIQQFVDRDNGPGSTDFTCGPLSYDGHKGTDFALPTLREMQAGVDVLASAPGIVRGVRDGMEDLYYSQAIAPSIDGRDCGNGVAIDHGDGWVTQYCHMKKGSVQVNTGDTVKRGQALGQVGLSGRTQFPHVHISVRKDGKVVDPFGTEQAASCSLTSAGDDSLWADDLTYVPGAILDLGFADAVPDYADVRAGTADRVIRQDSSALVFYVFAFGSRAGDELSLRIDGPEGVFSESDVVLDRTQARYFRAAGRRNRSLLPPGDYTGTATVTRNGALVDTQELTITID